MAVSTLFAATSMMLQSYALLQNPNEDNAFNRDNAVYNLPKSQFEMQLRADFSWQFNRVEFWLKPRAYQTVSWSSDHFSGDMPDGVKQFDARLRLNEGGMMVYLNDQWSMDISREAWLWGASLFTNVTNPFFPNNGRNNPYRELGGTDNIKLSYLSDANWGLTLYSNFGRGNREVYEPTFAPSYVAQMDYKGETFNLGGLVWHREGDKTAAAVFAQWTVSEALLVYAEANRKASVSARYPKQADNILGVDLLTESTDDWRSDVVIGGSYAFEHGGVLGFEYAHLGFGYDDQQAHAYYTLGDSLAAFRQSADFDPLLFTRLTNATAETGLNALRQNYIFASYIYNGINDDTDINLRFAHNIDDDSQQLIVIVDHYIRHDLKAFFLINQTIGDAHGEFNQNVDTQTYLGIEYYFW